MATNMKYVTSGQRLGALDAIRGLAAVSVMWFHFYVFSNIGTTLQPHLPTAFDSFFRYGSLGVVVFFVLSGFVITLSLVDKPPTFSVLRNFTIRRSIRLDIPYLCVLFFATALLVAAHRPPTMGQFLSHVFYLQNILGYKNIVSQFWTLCYEIQFYLFFALCFITYRKIYFRKSLGNIIFIIPFAISLGFAVTNHASHGWFIDRWYEFALGACTLWFLIGNLASATWVAIMVGALCLGLVSHNIDLIVSSCAAAAIGSLGMLGFLCRTGGPILSWLGQISYSLYLIHFLGDVLTKKLVSPHASVGMAIAAFVGASLLSVVAAAALFYLIERPSHRLSRFVGSLPGRNPPPAHSADTSVKCAPSPLSDNPSLQSNPV